MMRYFQKGEIVTVMLLMMLVMVTVGWMGSGHMGMGHGGDHAEETHTAPSSAQSAGKGESAGKQLGNNSGSLE